MAGLKIERRGWGEWMTGWIIQGVSRLHLLFSDHRRFGDPHPSVFRGCKRYNNITFDPCGLNAGHHYQ
jgi:hypothetical protein